MGGGGRGGDDGKVLRNSQLDGETPSSERDECDTAPVEVCVCACEVRERERERERGGSDKRQCCPSPHILTGGGSHTKAYL